VQASTIAIDSSGDVFGTASGGATGKGYVWVLRKVSGSYETSPIILAAFPADGSIGNNTRDGLVIDSKGNLFGNNNDGYGTGNVGTLWELPKTSSGYGSLQLLKAFTDQGGQNADGLLSVDAADNIFGQAEGMGQTGNVSSIFEYTAGGTYKDLLDYDGYFGDPSAIGGFESNLVMDNQGNLYGTTINGGPNGHGSVIEIPFPYTSISNIATFDTVTSNPHGQLSILNNGATSQLFGISDGDEVNFTNSGVVWQLPINNGTAGNLITVGTFTGANGHYPSGGTVLTADGNLYGTTSATSNTSENPTVWESVKTGNAYGPPVTVASLPASTGAYPASGLVSDGTNLFGTTSQTNAADGGSVFGVGPATIPTGNTPVPTTYLLPVVTKSTLPTTAVGGQLIKGSVNVSVTNTTGAIEKGAATVGMYAYDGTNFFLLGFQKHAINLKPGKKATFHINAKGTLNAGTYSVLPYAFDATNQSTGAVTPTTLQVNAPVIALTTSAVTAVKPAKIKLGKAGNFTVTITNTGNIDTSGLATITAGLSIDGVTTAIALPVISHTYKIKAGHKIVLHVRVPVAKDLTPGSYFATMSYTQNGVTASAVGVVAFVVTS
jgi:hypothetical protein